MALFDARSAFTKQDHFRNGVGSCLWHGSRLLNERKTTWTHHATVGTIASCSSYRNETDTGRLQTTRNQFI